MKALVVVVSLVLIHLEPGGQALANSRYFQGVFDDNRLLLFCLLELKVVESQPVRFSVDQGGLSPAEH